MLSPAECPQDPDEVAESLILKRLSLEDAEAYRAHLKVCKNCQATLAENRAFISSLKAADPENESDLPS